MNETRPFASLTSGLLARKGAARPAMRPQLQPFGLDDSVHGHFGGVPESFHAISQDDLGWNDMGEDVAQMAIEHPQVIAITADVTPDGDADRPEVLKQIESLANVITRKAARDARIAEEEALASPRPSRRKGEALKEGRKAAFTLRLDTDRHLRLRLACSLESRSAQAVVVEALDHFLNDIPGMDEFVRRASRS